MLYDTVEEHREKPAVDQSGRALVYHWETNSPRGCFAVEVIETVFRKARIERADVRRVVEVDPPGAIVVVPDPRCAIRWNRRVQLRLPIPDLRDDRVDGGVRVFERQQQ